MALKSRWAYESAAKLVRKPAKKLQCVIARGLISGWKIPVYFAADEPMTLRILKTIVMELEKKGFKVWGASFDLGNKEFLADIKFKDGNYCMDNPVDRERKFYFVPDPPHMLKLFRNHLFEKGNSCHKYLVSVYL